MTWPLLASTCIRRPKQSKQQSTVLLSTPIARTKKKIDMDGDTIEGFSSEFMRGVTKMSLEKATSQVTHTGRGQNDDDDFNNSNNNIHGGARDRASSIELMEQQEGGVEGDGIYKKPIPAHSCEEIVSGDQETTARELEAREHQGQRRDRDNEELFVMGDNGGRSHHGDNYCADQKDNSGDKLVDTIVNEYFDTDTRTCASSARAVDVGKEHEKRMRDVGDLSISSPLGAFDHVGQAQNHPHLYLEGDRCATRGRPRTDVSQEEGIEPVVRRGNQVWVGENAIRCSRTRCPVSVLCSSRTKSIPRHLLLE